MINFIENVLSNEFKERKCKKIFFLFFEINVSGEFWMRIIKLSLLFVDGTKCIQVGLHFCA